MNSNVSIGNNNRKGTPPKKSGRGAQPAASPAAISSDDADRLIGFGVLPETVAASRGHREAVASFAREYFQRGWLPVRLKENAKRPVEENWQELRREQIADIGDFVEPGTSPNIGISLGERSGGLVDVDLDCPETNSAAELLLPPTGLVWGRQSASRSHRGYVVTTPPKKATEPFNDPSVKGGRLLELRSTGGQTVVPPSILPAKIDGQPDEPVVWDANGEPAIVELAELRRAVRLTAAAALLGRYWLPGSRHDAALALAGGLLRGGWSVEEMEGFIRAVCTAANDDEVEDRVRAVEYTSAAAEAGESTTGWPRLVELLGEHGESIVAAVRRWCGTPDPASSERGVAADAGGNAEGKVADLLVAIGREADLWHDAARTGFATLGRLTHAIRSKEFRHHLLATFMARNFGRVPNADAISNAVNALEAIAVVQGDEHAVYNRIAQHEGKIYLDLADPSASVIEVDSEGWRLCDSPPVRFRKAAGMLQLPAPERGGSLDNLRQFLNVTDDDAFALVKAWAAATFRPEGPFPFLVLLGEQGSAKSTTARVLKKLIDPSTADIRCEPREARDLLIQARNGWVLAFDNLSGIRVWLSDALCRLATGGGFSTRELYTDDGEVIFDSKRPVVLNGIEDFVTRGDLLERAILLRHPPIPDNKRRPESTFWAEFDLAHPRLLGAVLERVSGGLRELPRLKLGQLPRMADFALFATACERGSGEASLFLIAYADNQAGANQQALDGSPIGEALVAFMEKRPRWTGRASELLSELTSLAPEPLPRDWPRKPNTLTNQLRRVAPDVRRLHNIVVECNARTPDRQRQRMVSISWASARTRLLPANVAPLLPPGESGAAPPSST